MTTIVHAPLGDSVRVFDGRSGWIASPDRPVSLLPLTGGDVTGAKIDATLVFSTGIKQLFPQWRVADTTIDAKDDWMLEGIAPGQLPLRLYFDQESGLLVRALRLIDTVIGYNPTQLDFSDYRPASRIKVPYHQVITWTDNRNYNGPDERAVEYGHRSGEVASLLLLSLPRSSDEGITDTPRCQRGSNGATLDWLTQGPAVGPKFFGDLTRSIGQRETHLPKQNYPS